MLNNFYFLSETENLLDDLEMTYSHLKSDGATKYKWALIALYEVLYTTLLLGIENYDSDPVIYFGEPNSKSITKKYTIWTEYRNGASFEDLYTKFGKETVDKTILSPRIIGISEAFTLYTMKIQATNSGTLEHPVLRQETQDTVRKLITIRDNFIHFGICDLAFSYQNIHKDILISLKLVTTILIAENKLSATYEDEVRFNRLVQDISEICSISI